MRKKKNNVYVGLDGLDIKVNTTKVLEQNYYIFYNNNNDETGHLQAVKDGYLLHLCLPKLLRTDNKIPFGKEDFKHIENVLECVQTQLESLFEDDIYETMVRTCEVNATAELSDVTKTPPHAETACNNLIDKRRKAIYLCHGRTNRKEVRSCEMLMLWGTYRIYQDSAVIKFESEAETI